MLTNLIGNLPVDSAIFLEFLPGSHQWLLTVLSIDWALASVITKLIAWPILGNLTCQQDDENCTRSENMGWRYFIITMGGITLLMWCIRFLAFTIYESPKYYMSKGNDEKAVEVVREVARRNGKTTLLTVDDLKACEILAGNATAPSTVNTSNATAVKRNLEKFNLSHVRALFATRKLAISTGMIMGVWGMSHPSLLAWSTLTTSHQDS
jgi:MFS family permease